MAGLTQADLRGVQRRQVCSSGETRFFTVPAFSDKIGYVTGLTIDTAFASGQFGAIQVQLVDNFESLQGTAQNASGGQVLYQTQLIAGDVVSPQLDSPVQFIGGLGVNVNLSGPIVSVSAVMR